MNIIFKCTGLLLLITFIGCEKDIETPSTRVYLKRIYLDSLSSGKEWCYEYSEEGRLDQRDKMYLGIPSYRSEFAGCDNKTIIVQFGAKTSGDHALTYKGTLNIFYKNDKILKTIYSAQGENYESNYFYNDKGEIETIIRRDTFIFTGDLIERHYEYDSKGNIKKIEENIDNDIYNTYIYEYDDKRNPFFKLDPIFNAHVEVDLISFLCPNNPTKFIHISGKDDTLYISDYYYDYNADGLPNLSYRADDYIWWADIGDSDSTGTRYYEYEVKE